MPVSSKGLRPERVTEEVSTVIMSVVQTPPEAVPRPESR